MLPVNHAPAPVQTDYFAALQALWQSQPYPDGVEPSNFTLLLQTNPALKLVLNAGPCLSWVLHVRTGQYVFVSRNAERMLGYPSEAFRTGGLAHVHRLIHPEDAPALWQLQYRVWKLLLSRPAADREDYQFNYDYRIRRADGRYLRLLEQNMVLQTDEAGNILYLLGVCTDITNWKQGEALVASVQSADWQPCLVCTSTEPRPSPVAALSKREKEIIRLMAAGYSSKQIAGMLCISFHTVNTHRQHIIEKTGSKNYGEVIQYALTQGVI